MREILSEETEKGGPSIFKKFQFINQLFDCALH